MHQAEIVVLLFDLVALLAVLACRLTLPYPIVLVIGGLALSFVPRLPEVRLNPETVFYFILPALLYPAALFTSWRDFRRNLRPILLLAIGLVLATTLTIAWIAHTIVPALPWAAAFALGAIVSPPDAIAATAIIRRLGVPHRIEAILEGESLVNDATALVALQFAVAALMTGRFSLAHATLEFIWLAWRCAGCRGISMIRRSRSQSLCLLPLWLICQRSAYMSPVSWQRLPPGFFSAGIRRSLLARVIVCKPSRSGKWSCSFSMVSSLLSLASSFLESCAR